MIGTLVTSGLKKSVQSWPICSKIDIINNTISSKRAMGGDDLGIIVRVFHRCPANNHPSEMIHFYFNSEIS